MQKPQIIIPQGPPVKRIVIEIDAKGSALLKANSYQPNGLGQTIKGPMEALEVALILIRMADNSIQQHAIILKAMEGKTDAKQQSEITEGNQDEAGAKGPRHN